MTDHYDVLCAECVSGAKRERGDQHGEAPAPARRHAADQGGLPAHARPPTEVRASRARLEVESD